METKVGKVVHMSEIQAPKKYEKDSEEDYQKKLEKFRLEQSSGVTKKLFIKVKESYTEDAFKEDEIRIYSMKVHEDQVKPIGSKVIVNGNTYATDSGKIGFQTKNLQIQLLDEVDL